MLHYCFLQTLIVNIVDWDRYSFAFVADFNDKIRSFKIFDFLFDKGGFLCGFFFELLDD